MYVYSADLLTRAKIDDRLPEIQAFGKSLKDEHGFSSVAIQGYCWGMSLRLNSRPGACGQS